MFYELFRAFIQRLFRDKILAGLVIVGFLAIFVGGFGGGHSEHRLAGRKDLRQDEQAKLEQNQTRPEAQPQQQQQPQAQPQNVTKAPAQPDPPNPAGVTRIEPTLATQFMEWWVIRAMDFNPQTAFKSRQEAMSWIVPEAMDKYKEAFWPPEISDGIASGKIQGSFTLASVKPVASNPDGSIVVNVGGNLVLAEGQKPVVQQLSTDYLIRRETGGLRVAGLFNRAVLLSSAGAN